VTFRNFLVIDRPRPRRSCLRPYTRTRSNQPVHQVNDRQIDGERVRQLDLRVTRVVSVHHARLQVMVDPYNALNSSPVLVLNNTYGVATGALGRFVMAGATGHSAGQSHQVRDSGQLLSPAGMAAGASSVVRIAPRRVVRRQRDAN
jgi:hypothetical protein